MKKSLLILFILSFFCEFQVMAQKKVLGYPKIYIAPLNPYEDRSEAYFTSEDATKDKDRDRGWYVVVDRDGTTAYSKPNPGSSKRMTLPFASSYYVTERDGDWFYLVDAIVDRVNIDKKKQDIGWVHINNLLLWNEALINPRTQIHLKSLLLNRFENLDKIPCDKKEIVKVYLNPSGRELKSSVNIYRFYFVYKIEGNRYLLGETPELGRYDMADRLLGWVDKDRLEEWNTRIALEPNFTQAGYDERKGNPKVRIVGFEDEFATEEYAETGKVSGDYILWRGDPVDADKNDLSKSDSKRFRGDFMRFPLLSVGAQSMNNKSLPYYKSAVCDEIVLQVGCDGEEGTPQFVRVMPPDELGDAIKYIEQYQEAADNFNIFFVIESTNAMAPYKSRIAELSDAIESTIRARRPEASISFGGLSYKDVAESSDPGSLINYRPISPDKSSFQRFVRNTDFSNPNSNGNHPVQNYALFKALQVAAFKSTHTNIMIVLGTKGDYTYDRLVGMKYKDSETNQEIGDLTDAINKGSVNLLGVQCVGGNLEGNKAFARNLRGIMLEAARKNYSRKFVSGKMDDRVVDLAKKNGVTFTSPEMDDPDESREASITLQNGTLDGMVFRMDTPGKALSSETMAQIANENVEQLTEKNIELWLTLENMKFDKIDPSKGFSRRAWEILNDLYKNVETSADLSEEKFELYKRVFFARQSKLASEPSFSFVLFWPERDLERYYAFIEKTVLELSRAPMGERRNKLKDVYCKLLEEFSGGEYDKACEDYTIDEIFGVIQGVKNEGISFGFGQETIKCLVDPKCLSNEQVENLIQNFADVKVKLGDLVYGASDNEFIFKRGDESFFWIEINDVY